MLKAGLNFLYLFKFRLKSNIKTNKEENRRLKLNLEETLLENLCLDGDKEELEKVISNLIKKLKPKK